MEDSQGHKEVIMRSERGRNGEWREGARIGKGWHASEQASKQRRSTAQHDTARHIAAPPNAARHPPRASFIFHPPDSEPTGVVCSCGVKPTDDSTSTT